ncbi:MAG: tetratricopeptide repeat protein [Pseudomonadota bacterium]
MNAYSRYLATCLIAALLCATPANGSPGADALEAGDYTRAIPLLRDELSKGQKAQTRLLLGRALVETNEFEDAYEQLEQVVELLPKNADAHYWFGAAAGSLAANVSMFKAAGYARKVKKSFTTAIELDPTHVPAHEGLIAFYTQAPAIAGGSRKKAIKTAEQLQKFAPIDGGLMLASVYGSKQQEKAIEVLAAVAKRAPNDPRAMLRAGFIYQEDKAFEQAHDSFTAASTAGIDDPDTLTERLAALYQIGRTAVFSKSRYAEGIKALEQYEAQFIEYSGAPPVAWAKYRRGQLYTMAGDEDAARAAYLDAKSITDDDDLIKNINRALK